MGLPSIGTPVRASGKDASMWYLEWTYTDGSGAPSLDTDQSDDDPRIATPVADGGTGITNVQFPKCDRVKVIGLNFEPPTGDLADGTDYRLVNVTERDADAGTLNVRFCDVEGSGNLLDPTSGARVCLTLLLEYP